MNSLPQPETLQLINSKGDIETFHLWVPHQVTDEKWGKSIGPLYMRGVVADGPTRLLFQPDAGFLHANRPLAAMHPILFPGPVPKGWNPNEDPEPWMK